MKNSHWFPHPASLRHDRRMKRAMKDFPGAVAYGVIVLMMEVLRNEPDFKYPVRDLDLLSNEFDISLPILQTLISTYGFFEFKKFESEEIFVSPLLNELMIPYLQKQKQNVIAGQISAGKRKLKQEQQLHLLSRLGSSQHVLNICDSPAQENREEKSIKEYKRKENLSILDFSTFKKFIVNEYKGKIVCKGAQNYLPSTPISISQLGYLHNCINQKDLTENEAKSVWKWMYENQNKLLVEEYENES